jgi:hypothetical protein
VDRCTQTPAYHPIVYGISCHCESHPLHCFFACIQGQLLKLDEDDMPDDMGTQQQQPRSGTAAAAAAGGGDGSSSLLLTEQVKPRQGLPPLLVNLAERWVCVLRVELSGLSKRLC